MNFIKKILVAGCLAAAFSACKKDNISPEENLLYKMDGVLKTARPDAFYYPDNTIMIEGSSRQDDITIFIDTDIHTGVYPIGSMADKVSAMFVNWDHPMFFNSESGTLVIKTFDETHISGTFRFIAKNGQLARTFTEGEFNAKLSYDTGPFPEHDCPDSARDVTNKQRLMQVQSTRK